MILLVKALFEAISSGMNLSHERWSSDMQFRQQITWCWLQKKSVIKSGCLEHFTCVVSTSPGKVDMVQNRQQNRDRIKIDEKTIVKQISAFKESIIKKLDELEKLTLLEMQTVSLGSICQTHERWSSDMQFRQQIT
jgi:hypothetical protein